MTVSQKAMRNHVSSSERAYVGGWQLLANVCPSTPLSRLRRLFGGLSLGRAKAE